MSEKVAVALTVLCLIAGSIILVGMVYMLIAGCETTSECF